MDVIQNPNVFAGGTCADFINCEFENKIKIM